MKMSSADHLNFLRQEALSKKLAAQRIAGVLVPGTDFCLQHSKPFNPRPMIEEGMIMKAQRQI